MYVFMLVCCPSIETDLVFITRTIRTDLTGEDGRRLEIREGYNKNVVDDVERVWLLKKWSMLPQQLLLNCP